MEKRQKLIRSITIDAMFLALIIIMATVPYIGFINIGIISITLIHINVLIGAYMWGWKKGLLYGFFFGMVSWLRALTASSGFDLFFMNPLISVLPRVLFGLVSGLMFELIRKKEKSATKNALLIGASVGLTIFHSFTTLSMIGLLKGGAILANYNPSDFASIWQWIGLILVTNGIAESVVAGIAIIPLSHALSRKLVIK